MWLGTTMLTSIAIENVQHHRKFYMTVLGYNIHMCFFPRIPCNLGFRLCPLGSLCVCLNLTLLVLFPHRHVSSFALLILLSPWTISHTASFAGHICKWVYKSACICHSLKVQTSISRDQQVLTHCSTPVFPVVQFRQSGKPHGSPAWTEYRGSKGVH